MTDSTRGMQRRTALICLAAGAACGHAAAADLKFWPFERRASRRPLLIAGARAMFALNQALAQAFLKVHTNIDVVVESGGSLSALIALKRGSVDVAAMSRDLKVSEEEVGLKSYLVARNGLGIVVGPSIKLASLQPQQLRALLSGEIPNWSQVGGPSAAVQVVSRTRGSTARQLVEEVILGGGDVASSAYEAQSALNLTQMVASMPYSIGYISLKDKLTAAPVTYMDVGGVTASRETLLSGRYPYTQSLYLVTRSEGQSTARLFVDFVCSAAGQGVVDAANMVGTY